MIGLPATVRVFVAVEPADFRKVTTVWPAWPATSSTRTPSPGTSSSSP